MIDIHHLSKSGPFFVCVQGEDEVEGNSAAIALERFGRAPAAEQPGGKDADALSAATAVQRLMLDKSAGPSSRGNAALLPRPTPPHALAGNLLYCHG